MFNPSNKLVVDCYADADFAGLWGHENPQDPICARSRTGVVVTFSNFLLLRVSKLQTEIDISTLHSDYVAFSVSNVHNKSYAFIPYFYSNVSVLLL